ncbi:STAS domain-containing protein [Salipaludibacillus daqingensis]|uniref:STAS domain-containing protein n=1 Tax=Salipaludibacillus daqingensis TaxID=3041001 RepID=UPI0024767CE8|nr:STAS domain-containing protein [Salipaludibacillus daqingensis]
MGYSSNKSDIHTKEIYGMGIEWAEENGSLNFSGEFAMVIWVETAMRNFLDTIEEISGSQVVNLVLETAGYRMGEMVSDFFKTSEINDMLETLPRVYGAAGWGLVTIEEYSLENKTAVLRIKDSWEYRINKKQGRKEESPFLPGHFAGLLTNLYSENIWYSMKKSQLKGEEYCEYHFAPSSITPNQNIHELTRSQEQYEILKLEEMVDERTKELKDLVREISSPIIPVLDGIVVIPLMGTYDDVRADELLQKTLAILPEYKAKYVILDMTGISEGVDEYMISLILKMTQAASLLGSQCILVGISPSLSIEMTKADFSIKEANITSYSTLKHAILYALSQEGKQLL